ncbi:MAG: hypothetical protein WC728_06920 [Elusimicrobiota bacterium]
MQACVLLLTLFAAEARADLSFVQVVQAQSSGNQDGVFGKSWVEVLGRRMRIVSGYARRVLKGKKPEEARRVVQILDLPAKSRMLLFPESKSYSRGSLEVVDYDDRLAKALVRTGRRARVGQTSYSLKQQPGSRSLLGAQCTHYLLRVTFQLVDSEGRAHAARMDQHIWLAPVTGKLSNALLDLMAFENAYREAAGGGLSPLDHERYQVREAAAYLGVPEEELRGVASEARSRMRDLPSYPVASLVAWWRLPRQGGTVKLGDVAPVGKAPHPARKEAPHPARKEARSSPRKENGRAPRTAAPRPPMRPFDWRGAERQINRMVSRTWEQMLQPPRRGAAVREEDLFPRFETELKKVLIALVAEQDQLAKEFQEQAAMASQDVGEGQAPFYEVYAELHGLERDAVVRSDDFHVPISYKEKRP